MTKTDQVRLTTWRFKVLRQAEERARSVAQTCRHFGISRKTFYKWERRFVEHGEAGLCCPREARSGQPFATNMIGFLVTVSVTWGTPTPNSPKSKSATPRPSSKSLKTVNDTVISTVAFPAKGTPRTL